MKFAFPSFSGASAKKAVTSLDQRSKMMAYDQPLVWVVLLLMLFGRSRSLPGIQVSALKAQTVGVHMRAMLYSI